MNFAKLPSGKYINLDRVEYIDPMFPSGYCFLRFWMFGDSIRIEEDFESKEEAEKWIKKNIIDRDLVLCQGNTEVIINAVKAKEENEKTKKIK